MITIAACPHQQPPGRGLPAAAACPLPARTSGPPGHLRRLPRAGAPGVRPLLPVRAALICPGRYRADAVVPASYAVKGTGFAVSLGRYKSWRAPDPAARTSLLALLLAFLHDHGPCVWRHAGMPAPGRLAVVPTGCGRPGPHPLLELSAPYLRLPVTGLAIRPGEQGRDPNVDRFSAERSGPGASVLLLDDSWVSGASAQSAARRAQAAGARHVAVVVLCRRHVDPADPLGGPLAARLGPRPYDLGECAVHAVSAADEPVLPGPKLER